MPNNKSKVEIQAYDPHWASQFRQEAAGIAAVFGDQAIAIHHIGSTSVPGLIAKPIIDLMLEVKEIDQVDSFNDQMRALGYDPRGEHGLPRRRYFQKLVDGAHIAHVHTWQTGDPELERHISFRDYMIAHPEAAAAYGQLKKELVQRFDNDKEQYIDGKDQFCKDYERRAVAWRRSIRAHALETNRTTLLPLNRAELWQYLHRPGQLEAALQLRLSRTILTETVRQAMRTKLRKMAGLTVELMLWQTYWLAIIGKDSFGAGLIGFKGAPEDGEVEIGYGIDITTRRKGYGTETSGALINWALTQPACTVVSATTEKENVASIRVLEKLGFSRVRATDEEFYWVVAKPTTT